MLRAQLARLLSRSAAPSRVLPLDGPSLAVALARPGREVVVAFWAPRCLACRALAPHIERLADERPDITVVTLDVDRHPRAAGHHEVEQLPTVVRFCEGQMVAVAVGALDYDVLRDHLSLHRGARRSVAPAAVSTPASEPFIDGRGSQSR